MADSDRTPIQRAENLKARRDPLRQRGRGRRSRRPVDDSARSACAPGARTARAHQDGGADFDAISSSSPKAWRRYARTVEAEAAASALKGTRRAGRARTATHERRHLMNVALHEAGHAVASYYLGTPLQYSTIVRRGRFSGHTRQRRVRFDRRGVFDKSPDGRDRAERHILVALAGVVAQGRYAPDPRCLRGSDSDIELAMKLFWHISERDAEARHHYFSLLYRRTQLLIENHWQDVLAVASTLVQRKTLSAEEIADLIRPRRRGAAVLLQRKGRSAQPAA